MRFGRLGCTTVAMTLLATATLAQATAPVRVRGTIAELAGNSLTIKERNGQSEEVTLDEPVTVTTVRRLALEAIKPGSYIGVTARPAADGTLVALEVHAFPEEMRGVGEGNRPWDLEAGSTMTNANVTGVVESGDGSEVTLTYKDGSKTIRIPPTVPVVTFASADRSDLKPGTPVFLIARSLDGKLHASRVTAGTSGVAPPM
jgi:hypothetical protein